MENTAKKMVIALGGAFNPIHLQHIRALEIAKELLERDHNFEIIAGYLAIAEDGYVASKLGTKGMKGEHRIRMANLDSSFLQPVTSLFASAQICAEKLKPKDDNVETSEGIIILVGSDRGTGKWRRKYKDNIVHVCIGRGEHDSTKQAYTKDLNEGKTQPDTFILLDAETEEFENEEENVSVSSSLVRNFLDQIHQTENLEEKQLIMKNIVEKKLISEKVGDYLLQHESDLYLPPKAPKQKKKQKF